ncbi:MAG: class I SAM-dependent methyltransferase [Gammaproteobacteria bacterium]|nr:class I SAM-dependent methyltransferase [Gammaproteobacteria bacterium]MDH3411447.1 class I SAM-dependent methyltransferase [Gammaproteobacteria bacterium]
MKRIPEPELMDASAQAEAYAEADFSESNALFVELFRGAVGEAPAGGRVLDLGCGPADIPVRLARAFPQLIVDAVDGSESMLRCARDAVQRAGFGERINLTRRRLPDQRLEMASYGAVISNSLLHHLVDPLDLWKTVIRCAGLGAAVVVMDLIRPDEEADVDALVKAYARDAPEVLRQDFRASLCAAYTLEEVAAQLEAADLTQLEPKRVSDRHWAVAGRLAA